MKKTILLMDCNYLCYRAFYSTGSLSYGSESTGVVYGFLRDLIDLQDRFQPYAFCFCFDFGTNLRKIDYPEYKANRTPMPEEFKEQVRGLRKNYLRNLGYNNIFYKSGYEADDFIALICNQLGSMCRGVIVSGDGDMFQLLGRRVSVYQPAKRRTTTEDSFAREYGVSPAQWVDCKAIAGCTTDNIKGIKGVAEKTAAKFLNGTLKSTSKAFQSIVAGNSIWKRNRHLVRLPYPGLDPVEIKEDKVRAGAWEDLADRLGMKSIRNKAPSRGTRKGFGIF